MTKQISVVIITMNRRALIEKSVPILLDDPATAELIVVIDGARDGTLELLELWAQREERLRPIWQENAGEGAARERGVEASRRDVVVLLDDDVIPAHDLITQHARHHAVDDVDVVLGYMPTNVPTQRRRGQVPTILYASDYEATCRGYDAHPETIWAHFWSGNFSIRRERALAIGLGGKIRLGYHEDLYFGLRCHEAGLKVEFDRLALGHHQHSRSLRKFSREVQRSGDARAVLVKWFPRFTREIDPLSGQSAMRRRILTMSSGSLIRGITTPTLMATSWCAGVLHIWFLETNAARIMRQIELLHAFRRRTRRLDEPRTSQGTIIR